MPLNEATAARRGALITLELRYEHDVVLARQRARQIAELLECESQDQTRLATAVSELARNAFRYARNGRVTFEVSTREHPTLPMLLVRVSDEGPGIADLDAVLNGRYQSTTGMGLGLVGARRLTDHFRITSSPARGTIVEIGRLLTRWQREFQSADAVRIADALAAAAPESPFEEIQQQNQELVRTLDEVQSRKAEVERLNIELQETNRGVLALYAELDDRAHDLRRASEAKSRFLSEIGHELRTPLTSVLNLSRLLIDRIDGDLSPEQERQISLIRKSVQQLMEMVNDLLDLAKIEAGKIDLRLSQVSIPEVFATLRGVCRPLMTNDAVALIFEDPVAPPVLTTDETRLTQILRNFISNAIKFTERGEVRIRLRSVEAGIVRFDVIDTGLGIAPMDHARIFDEYTQIDSPLQRRVAGTGLGLPLTRRLASLLGGRIELTSALGKGSTFSLIVPERAPGST